MVRSATALSDEQVAGCLEAEGEAEEAVPDGAASCEADGGVIGTLDGVAVAKTAQDGVAAPDEEVGRSKDGEAGVEATSRVEVDETASGMTGLLDEEAATRVEADGEAEGVDGVAVVRAA